MRKLKFDKRDVLEIVSIILGIVIPVVVIGSVFILCSRCDNCDSFCPTRYCTQCGFDNVPECVSCGSAIVDSYKYCPKCGTFIDYSNRGEQ